MMHPDSRQRLRRSALLVIVVLLLAGVAVHGVGDVSPQYRHTYTDSGQSVPRDSYSHRYIQTDTAPRTDADTATRSSTAVTRSQQHVRGDGETTYVEQSTAGDGTVRRRVEQRDGGVHASQQVRDTETGDRFIQHRRHGMENGKGKRTVTDTEKQKRKDVIIVKRPVDRDRDSQPNRTGGTGPGSDNNNTGVGPVPDMNDTQGPSDDGTNGNDTMNGSDGFGGIPVPGTPGDVIGIGNGTTDGSGGTGDGGSGDTVENLTDENGTELDQQNGASEEITDLTPREGSRILGDQYQTPPADMREEPQTVQRRLGLLDRIRLFLQRIIAGLVNWFERAGTL